MCHEYYSYFEISQVLTSTKKTFFISCVKMGGGPDLSCGLEFVGPAFK